MSQSLSKVIVHIIFSTKNRIDYLENEFFPNVHSYIAVILRDMNSYVYIVGGTENHIHIACTLPRTISQSAFLNKIKNVSSKWIKAEFNKDFYWQNGYGVFSVNQSKIDSLVEYIRNQKEHHKEKTFQEEFIEFLEKYQIKYDEKYIWE